MANIVDPRVIAFGNNRLRPLAEIIRNLKPEIDQAIILWNGSIAALTPNDTSVYADGRSAVEGLPSLVGSDLYVLINTLTSIQTSLNVSGVSLNLEKISVRPLDTGS